MTEVTFPNPQKEQRKISSCILMDWITWCDTKGIHCGMVVRFSYMDNEVTIMEYQKENTNNYLWHEVYLPDTTMVSVYDCEIMPHY